MSETQTLSSAFRQYYDLTKPRVVMLIVFTAIVGMLLAVQGIPDLKLVLIASFGIGLAASAGAVMNQIIDMRADAIMARIAVGAVYRILTLCLSMIFATRVMSG